MSKEKKGKAQSQEQKKTENELELERLQNIMHLKDWNITVSEVYDEADACGKAFIRRDYKEAKITLYPDMIDATSRHFPNETELGVIRHELGEIVVDGYMSVLPEEWQDDPRMIMFCDCVADHISRIVKGLDS